MKFHSTNPSCLYSSTYHPGNMDINYWGSHLNSCLHLVKNKTFSSEISATICWHCNWIRCITFNLYVRNPSLKRYLKKHTNLLKQVINTIILISLVMECFPLQNLLPCSLIVSIVNPDDIVHVIRLYLIVLPFPTLT